MFFPNFHSSLCPQSKLPAATGDEGPPTDIYIPPPSSTTHSPHQHHPQSENRHSESNHHRKAATIMTAAYHDLSSTLTKRSFSYKLFFLMSLFVVLVLNTTISIVRTTNRLFAVLNPTLITGSSTSRSLESTFPDPDPTIRVDPDTAKAFIDPPALLATSSQKTPISSLAAATLPLRPPVVEYTDCSALAPCRVVVAADDDAADNITCVTFYAKRFWESAPTQLMDNLQWHRDRRPANCWYETELLQFTKVDNVTDRPYDNAVCQGPIPDTVVYWHNFKAAGTTVRHALGHWGFPNYDAFPKEVYSDQMHNIFNNLGNTSNGLDEYLQYADEQKRQIHERQSQTNNNIDNDISNNNKHVGFTFVRPPVQRFLSGLEQVERLNNYDWEVSPESRPCFDISDSVRRVECIVDHLLETRVFFNVHIYPQAYVFDAWTQRGELDLAVVVLHMKDMDPLMSRFKGEVLEHRMRNSAVDGTTIQVTEDTLEPRLLAKICKLYESDLLLLQTLGMEDEKCSNALSSSGIAAIE